MKPIDILDALSDLPEEYTAFAAHSEPEQAASEDKTDTHTPQGRIIMKKNAKSRESKIHFSKAGIAAAVAVCIGLNAALIYGISRMKQDPGITASGAAPDVQEVQESDRIYMKIHEDCEPTPTGVLIQVFNMNAENHLAVNPDYNPQFIVMQDGKKVADCDLCPESISQISIGANCQQLCFERLPAGSYTLVNLAADGESEGILGHVDFEISADFDSMVWIPVVRGMDFDEAKALLEEKGVNVEKKYVNHSKGSFTNQVLNMLVQPYKTEQTEDGEKGYLHEDGRGYWVNEGDVITLTVNLGNDSETEIVPYVIGQDYEQAKTAILEQGYFSIDKRSAFYDDVPAGTVVEETVENIAVPEGGLEAPVGSYVRIVVSLGKKTDAAAQDSNTDADDTETVTVPDFTGLDWETARQQAAEFGLRPGKVYFDSQGEPAGTVTFQSYLPGDAVPKGYVIMFHVAKDPQDNPMHMDFGIPENIKFLFYIYVQDAQGEIIGVSYPFESNGYGGPQSLYPDCAAENTKAEAVLVNCETKQEAVIGSYILHPETGTYETISEDTEAAFRQVQ